MNPIRNRVTETRSMPLWDILPHAGNPKDHPDGQRSALRSILAEIGWAGSALAYYSARNGGKLTLIDAHLRREEVPREFEVDVLITDLTDAEADKLILVYDPIAAMAELNRGRVAQLLEGRGEGAVARLMEEVAARAGMGVEKAKGEDPGGQVDRAEELQAKWQVEVGDLWQLGAHRVVCGDCTSLEIVKRIIDLGTAKLVFTDPPYGVGIGQKNIFLNSFQKAGRNLSDIAGDLMGKDELLDMLVKAFTNVREVMDDCASIYVTAPQGGELGLMMMMMMMSGLPVRHVLNWVKNAPTFSLGRLDYDYQHEPILYTWKKTHVYYGKGAHTKSVWFIDKPRESKEHPTMKPVALYENALLNSSVAGDLVYEPFLGSGTSVIACENLGRRCRGVELAPKYVAVTLERWATMTGQMPVLLERVSA